MAEVLYQRWSFLNVGVFQWPLVQTFSSLICFRWKFPSLLHRGLRQRMICYCWYVTNFGDQVGLTTNAALQKEWSHQLALWISYQGNGDDDHQNVTEYHLVFTKKQIKTKYLGGWGDCFFFSHLNIDIALVPHCDLVTNGQTVTGSTLKGLHSFDDVLHLPNDIETRKEKANFVVLLLFFSIYLLT